MSNKPFPFSVCKECCADTGTLTAKDITYTGDYYEDEPNVEDAINYLGGEIDKHSGNIADNFKSIQTIKTDITAIKEDVEEHTTSINNIIDDLANRPTAEEERQAITDIGKINENIGTLEGDVEQTRTWIADLDGEVKGNKTATDIALMDMEERNRNTFANALKGSATGEKISLKDISPVEHIMDVNVRSKNLFNYQDWIDYCNSGVDSSAEETTYLDEECFRYDLWQSSSEPIFTDIKFKEKTQYTFTLSAAFVYEDNEQYSVSPFTIYYDDGTYHSGLATQLYKNNFTSIKVTTTPGKTVKGLRITRFSNIGKMYIKKDMQIEEGVTETAYTPFVDISTIKLNTLGKNLFPSNEQLSFPTNNNISFDCDIPQPFNLSLTLNIESISVPTTAFIELTYDDGSILYLAPSIWSYTLGEAKRFNNVIRDNGKILKRVKFLNWGKLVGTVSDMQIELGKTATEYEPYKEPIEYAVNEDGTVTDVKSIYPNMILTTDTVGAVIDVEYNRDINKAFAELQQAIISLGGNI